MRTASDPGIQILPADLDDVRIVKLLSDHYYAARAQTALGSAHALDLTALRMREVSVWAACLETAPVGVGALKRLSTTEGEIKSMYTVTTERRLGIAHNILDHIVSVAREERLNRLSLETGSWPYFEPARHLYKKFGFTECGPFGNYKQDPNSVFLTMRLGKPSEAGEDSA